MLGQPKLPDRGHVRFGAVAFMPIKTILRQLFMKAQHIAVTVDFGDDGSGSNNGMELVAFDDSFLIGILRGSVQATIQKQEARIMN